MNTPSMIATLPMLRFFSGSIAALALSMAAHAAGPLTPPGVPGNPAADMPSLVEIKTSVDVAGLNGRTGIPKTTGTPAAGPAFTISQPGSYVLLGNLVVSSGDGIQINASNVELDLNGFSIQSTNTMVEGRGINIAQSVHGVRIHNGRINSDGGRMARNKGFFNAITFQRGGSDPVNGLVFENLNIADGNITADGAGSVGTSIVCRQVSFYGWSNLEWGTTGVAIHCTFDLTSAPGASDIVECSGPGLFVKQTPVQFDGRGGLAGTNSLLGATSRTISSAGNYVLQGNITVSDSGDGIHIMASNVTLDLNGFTISSNAASPSGAGIKVGNGIKETKIRNGRITGGFAHGVLLNNSPSTPNQIVIEDLTISGLTGTGNGIGLTERTLAGGDETVTIRRVDISTQTGGIALNHGSNAFGKVIDCNVTCSASYAGIIAGVIINTLSDNQGTGDDFIAGAHLFNSSGP